jgi:putative FmdB family regulatory protein
MPIYEYEPVGHECVMCPNRVGVIQSISDEPLQYCPDCGLEVRRVISVVSINLRTTSSAVEAGKRGFTTWKKAGEGTWEKVAGPGADVLVGDPRDVKKVKETAPAAKKFNLDGSV